MNVTCSLDKEYTQSPNVTIRKGFEVLQDQEDVVGETMPPLCLASFLFLCRYRQGRGNGSLQTPRSRSPASTQEIKKAYRKKALDTHPDKNKDVPAEEAAAAFQKVVHAFEVLSDSSSRKRYDRTGRSDDPGGGGGAGRHRQHNGGGFQWTFRWNTNSFHQRRPKPKLKDRFDVKQAQSRILHVVSLDQLELIMTTTNENNGNVDLILERNLLICFYTPPLEKLVMEEMVYPWPFAAMSSQGIWWEDLLQTTVVRFHKSNELSKFFGIPDGENLEKPMFLFGKRGQNFRDPEAWNRRLSTNDREVFDSWVWEQLQVEVTFINKHDHPVELYWVHSRSAVVKGILGPNETTNITTMLAHEWWVRDARTDTRKDAPGRHKLTEQTCLYNVKITSDTRSEYTIPKKSCYDLSGHCAFWNRSGRECSNNPTFMHEICALTCARCKKDEWVDNYGQNDADKDSELKNSSSSNNNEETKSSSTDEL